MANFFTILLFIFIFFLVAGLTFVARIVHTFKKQTRNFNNNQKTTTNRTSQQTQENSDNHKKIFSKDEGEYVDFEEIK